MSVSADVTSVAWLHAWLPSKVLKTRVGLWQVLQGWGNRHQLQIGNPVRIADLALIALQLLQPGLQEVIWSTISLYSVICITVRPALHISALLICDTLLSWSLRPRLT